MLPTFNCTNDITLIKLIPQNTICRSIIKVSAFVVDIQFIKIQYLCNVCRQDIDNEQICRNGCFIKEPRLKILVFCVVQDGSAKAYLSLKDEPCKRAFSLQEKNLKVILFLICQRFKEYCLKYGAFVYPANRNFNFLHNEIISCFKSSYSLRNLLIYCQPYCKVFINCNPFRLGIQKEPMIKQFPSPVICRSKKRRRTYS